VVGPQPELGQQRPAVRRQQPDTGVNASSSGSPPTNSALAWSISPTTTPGPSDAVPSSRAIRPSIAASSVDLPEPFAPVIATRSAQSICSRPARG
jgi:hypothetical protein